MKKINIVFILMIVLEIAACSNPKTSNTSEQTQQQTLVVSEQKQPSILYFDGTISPIQTKIVSSPIEGIVEAMNFNYGDQVKNGQLLLTLKSATLGKNYQQAISGYLTAKEKYGTSKSNMVGATDLYKAGITSQQTYAAAQSDLNDSYLTYLQAKQTLIDLFQSSGISEKNVYLLKIDDETAVKKALETPLKSINIYATMDGIALKPAKSGSSDSSSAAVHVGTDIKANQVIVDIGKMSGLKISIAVDELSINKINIGNPAKVTGPGFPGITLTGLVTAVSSQASTNDSGGGGLPTFPVAIAIENVTAAQQKVIHDGMSAKVEIDTGAPMEIIVPINSVHLQGNQTYVNLIDNSGKIIQQTVQTGQTTVDGVRIVSGLKPGDKIVISN